MPVIVAWARCGEVVAMADEAAERARTTYNAAADSFDDPAIAFWDRFGRATVERLDLRPGASVLDVCAGSGASALPAAERVAPGGRVVAVDVADNLLALARAKAHIAGLADVLETRCVDLRELAEPDGSFDAVVIVFGIFFLPDMVEAARRLWRLVTPGGQLAVTTWGPRLFEPVNTMFWEAVAALRPDLDRAYNPWDSLTAPEAVRDLLVVAGVDGSALELEAVTATQPMTHAQDAWTLVLGTGYRATHDALTATERAVVRDGVLAEVRARRVDEIETNVVYATATKGPPVRGR
jgi:ubiquinone/menaquinone biosynthesis C-methylase UbiE